MENDKPRIGIWDHYEMTRCAGQCSSRSKEESTDFKEEREDGDVRARKNDAEPGLRGFKTDVYGASGDGRWEWNWRVGAAFTSV